MSLVIEDVYKLATVIVTLLLWRGAWGMLQDKLQRELPLWSWLCHALSMCVMMALQVASTMGAVGCGVDGEAGPKKSVPWRIDYFQAWWRMRMAGPQRGRGQPQGNVQVG